MPASKVCSQPSCPHLMPCPVAGHAKVPWEGSTRRAELPPDWEKRRRAVLYRDMICTECGLALSREVHHTADKHDHRLEALAGVCEDCHKRLTAAQAAEARRGA